jgi:hypothetical protein
MTDQGDGSIDYPTAEVSKARLRRNGWSCRQATFTVAGATVWQADAWQGDHHIRSTGATQGEAWHRAAEQAAADGMLER